MVIPSSTDGATAGCRGIGGDRDELGGNGGVTGASIYVQAHCKHVSQVKQAPLFEYNQQFVLI